MKKVMLLLTFAVVLMFVSCQNGTDDYDFEIEKNEQFVIELESAGPSTGYLWEWEKHGKTVDTLRVEHIPYFEDHMGSPEIERWTFVGKHKGATTIRLTYKRPWETEILESREYSVRVK